MTELTSKNAKNWTRAKIFEIMEWAEEYFEVDGLTKAYVSVSASPRRKNSWGGVKKGKPYVSLLIADWIEGIGKKTNTFREYSFISLNPVIGCVYNASAKDCIVTVACHEIAHSIDYYSRAKNTAVDEKADYSVVSDEGEIPFGHEGRWQAIYAVLRNRFVNNGVTNPTKKVRNDFIKSTGRKNKTVLKINRFVSAGYTFSTYWHLGNAVAVGVKVGEEDFRIWEVTNENCSYDETGVKINLEGLEFVTIEDGRKARHWIMKNIIQK